MKKVSWLLITPMKFLHKQAFDKILQVSENQRVETAVANIGSLFSGNVVVIMLNYKLQAEYGTLRAILCASQGL